MIKHVLFAFLILFMSSCRLTNSGNDTLSTDMVTNKSTPEDGKANKAGITFVKDVYNFGKISQGEKVTFTFNFSSTGTDPLVIGSVKPSCGCTTPKDWPKEPLLPGETGEIEVEFNSEGKKGVQSKSITIISNTSPSTTVLTLEGEILSPN